MTAQTEQLRDLHRSGIFVIVNAWDVGSARFLQAAGAVAIATTSSGFAATLGLPDDALELTWRSLAEVGNLSSASVLHVLRDTMAKRPPAGSPGVLMAMGPGFCSELVLLRWR